MGRIADVCRGMPRPATHVVEIQRLVARIGQQGDRAAVRSALRAKVFRRSPNSTATATQM